MSCSYENVKPLVKRNLFSWRENWICMCYEAGLAQFSTVKFDMYRGSWNCQSCSEFDLWLLKWVGLVCCLWEVKTLCRSHAPAYSWVALHMHVHLTFKQLRETAACSKHGKWLSSCHRCTCRVSNERYCRVVMRMLTQGWKEICIIGEKIEYACVMKQVLLNCSIFNSQIWHV